jgi:uncharacterized membrane protein
MPLSTLSAGSRISAPSPDYVVDTRRGRSHNSLAANDCTRHAPPGTRIVNLRYLLAIAGLVVTAIVASVVWILLPHPPQAPLGAGSAQAQQSPAPGETEANDDSQGEFRVCNETGSKISVAFGYRAEKGWQSEGWWVADPTACVTVYHGDLESRRYYYIYAADDISGGAWDGDVYMCTRDETFTIFGVEDCLARGYERTGFFEVDTHNKSNWTLQLTEGDMVGGEGPADEEAVPLEGDLPTQDAPADGGDDQSGDDIPIEEGAPLE